MSSKSEKDEGLGRPADLGRVSSTNSSLTTITANTARTSLDSASHETLHDSVATTDASRKADVPSVNEMPSRTVIKQPEKAAEKMEYSTHPPIRIVKVERLDAMADDPSLLSHSRRSPCDRRHCCDTPFRRLLSCSCGLDDNMEMETKETLIIWAACM